MTNRERESEIERVKKESGENMITAAVEANKQSCSLLFLLGVCVYSAEEPTSKQRWNLTS